MVTRKPGHEAGMDGIDSQAVTFDSKAKNGFQTRAVEPAR